MEKSLFVKTLKTKIKFLIQIIIIAMTFFIETSGFCDDVLNTGGIFNKGQFVCDGSGANCVRAKQINNVGGITNNGDGSVQFLSSGGGGSPGGTGTEIQYRAGASTFGAVANSAVDTNGNVGINTTNVASLNFGVNGLVGIGTTLPFGSGVQLTISNGGGNVSRFNTGSTSYGGYENANNFGLIGYVLATGANTSLAAIPNSERINTGSGATGGIVIDAFASGSPIIFGSGGSAFSNERMRIDGNGNVGIGTNQITSILQVSSTAAQNLFEVDDNGPGDTSPFIIDSGGNVGIGTSTYTYGNPGVNLFSVSATPTLTMGNTSFTNPFTTLSLGSLFATIQPPTSTHGGLQIDGYSDNSTHGIILRGHMGTTGGVNSNSPLILKGGKMSGTTDGNLASTDNLALFENSDSTVLDTLMGDGSMSIKTTSVPSSALSVAGNGSFGSSYNTTAAPTDGLIVQGNTGIGSSNPGSVLDVNGAVDANQGSAALPSYGFLQDRTTGANLIGIGTYGLNTGGLERMRIDSVGNIGIGTNLTTTSAFTIMNGNVGIGTWKPNGSLIVQGGNVGVGTLTPGAFLDVNGGVIRASNAGSITTTNGNITSGANFFLTSSGQSVGCSSAGAASSTVLLGGASTTSFLSLRSTSASGTSDSIRFSTGAQVEKMRLTNAGNLGIGTSDPLAKLQIVGNIGIGTVANGDSFITTSPPNGGMIIEGNVGIGSITPGAPLDVAGKSRITAGGHIVSTGTAPTVASNDCGSTSQGTIVAKSTDNSGTVTVGTLTVTSCAVTFASAWANAPNCMVVDDTSVLTVRPGTISTTKLTINSTTSMSGDNVTWICQGNE